jgi:hypothetical protein
MWNRNEKAKKRLNRLRPTDEDKAMFEEWRVHTRRRMNRANLAAAMITFAPLAVLLGVFSGGVPSGGIIGGTMAAPQISILFNLCVWGAAFVAASSYTAGRKADSLATDLGFHRGLGWLASKKPTKKTAPIVQQQAGMPVETIVDPRNEEADSSDRPAEAFKQSVSTFGWHKFKAMIKYLLLATLAILLGKTLINPASHVLYPDVADNGPAKGHVVGFRYVKSTWWGFRKQIFEQIRFIAKNRPQYYNPKKNKWLDVPSEAYADSNDVLVEPVYYR